MYTYFIGTRSRTKYCHVITLNLISQTKTLLRRKSMVLKGQKRPLYNIDILLVHTLLASLKVLFKIILQLFT